MFRIESGGREELGRGEEGERERGRDGEIWRGRERERQRETETDRERKRERERRIKGVKRGRRGTKAPHSGLYARKGPRVMRPSTTRSLLGVRGGEGR